MSRRNLCPNPAAKNNTTGYSGSATFARVTDIAGAPRSTGVRASTAGYIQTPPAACAPGDVFTVSFYGENTSGSFDFGHTVYVAYTRSAGGDTFPETFSFGIGASGSTARGSKVAAAAPALATGIYMLWDSLSSGYAMTSVLLEKIGALDTYADGDTVSWVWDGTNGNSTSSEVTTTPVGRTLSTPWTVRGAVSQALSTPWTLRASVARSLDVPWAQRALVAQTLATPWNVRGAVSRTLDTPWALRNQISALLGTPWTVRKRVTSSLQVLWVVEGAPLSGVRKPAVGTALLTERATAYL